VSFYRKYELERLVQKAEPKTFRAREVSTGQAVYLHMLGGLDAASRRPLLDKALALLAAHNPAILDVDDSQFAPYVVTGIVEDFAGLPAWLERIPAGPPAAPPRAPAPRSPDAEITKTMEMSAFPVKGTAPAPAISQTPSAPPAARVNPPAPQAAPRQPAAAPVPPTAEQMPAASPGAEPGEFTKMFGGSGLKPAAPPPPAQTPVSAPPPARPSAAAPQPPRMQPPVAGAMPSAASEALGGSEFSQAFGNRNVPAAVPASEAGEFTRRFGAPPPAPSDNPAGFSPKLPPQPAPEAPLPWEPRAAAPSQPPVETPAAAIYPLVETPDTQKRQGATRPPIPVAPTPPPVVQQPAPQPPAYEGASSMWNSPPPAGSGPGEFTRFFGSPMAAGSLPIEEIERGRMPEAHAPADKPFDGPGEFTRFFGSSKPGDKTPPPQGPAQFSTFSGRASGLFNVPLAGAQPAPPIAPAQGPSEFTRQMNRGDLLPPEPAAYVPGNTGKPGRGALIAVIVAIVVVLVLLGVMLILTFRH